MGWLPHLVELLAGCDDLSLMLDDYDPERLGGMECSPRSGGPACSLARHL